MKTNYLKLQWLKTTAVLLYLSVLRVRNLSRSWHCFSSYMWRQQRSLIVLGWWGRDWRVLGSFIPIWCSGGEGEKARRRRTVHRMVHSMAILG